MNSNHHNHCQDSDLCLNEQTALVFMQKSFQVLQQATHLSLKCDVLDAVTRIVEK